MTDTVENNESHPPAAECCPLRTTGGGEGLGHREEQWASWPPAQGAIFDGFLASLGTWHRGWSYSLTSSCMGGLEGSAHTCAHTCM